MQVETFPYRVDDRTRIFLSSIIGALQVSNARITSPGRGINVQYLDKNPGSALPIDGPIAFMKDGVQIIHMMQAVAKSSDSARTWLRRFNEYISGASVRQGKGPLMPVAQRSFVLVEARYDGSMKYYMTYMAAHEDETLAQDTPQGRLYATEALATPQQPQAIQQTQAASKPAEDALWMKDE